MKVQSILGVNNSTGVNHKDLLSVNDFQRKIVKPSLFKTVAPSFKANNFSPCYTLASIYIGQIDKLKQETQQFPKDIKYREQLLVNAGLNPKDQHKIRSIIGPDEIKSVMRQYDSKPEVFSAGINQENVANKSIRANLHMHTRASDGNLTVHELLDKAAEYADKVRKDNPKIAEPFVVAITDHDTTEGAQEAIKIISEDPVKYRNLRVILGVEVSTFNNVAPNLVDKPTNTHVLVYGIDPNEKGFQTFLNNTKAKKYHIQEMMTDAANKSYKKHFGKDEFYSIPEAKQQYVTIRRNVVGTYNAMSAYFKTKAAVDMVLLKDKEIKEALEKKNLPTDTEGLMEKLSDFRKPIDNNARSMPPEKSLPEFVSAVTGMREDVVSQKLVKGMNQEKYAQFRKDLNGGIQDFKVTFTPKHDYMPTFETLYDGLKTQKGVVIGIAHPLDGVRTIKKSEDRYSFLEEFYERFKTGCKEKAKFTEAYYQSYKGELKEFNNSPQTQAFFKKVGKVLKIFRTGSADTHGLNIFLR